MPLLNPNKNRKQPLKISLNQAIIEEINDYVEHFGLMDVSDFLEQSAEQTLSKCSEWKKAKKTISNKKITS